MEFIGLRYLKNNGRRRLTAFTYLLLLGASLRRNLFLHWCPTTVVKSGRGYSGKSKTAGVKVRHGTNGEEG